jgi:hypothetical protein
MYKNALIDLRGRINQILIAPKRRSKLAVFKLAQGQKSLYICAFAHGDNTPKVPAFI